VHALAAEWIREAKSVLVLTGAGVSAESGVPTFRGPEGLWKDFRPEELANREAFLRDPALVWKWYLWRRQRIKRAQPNPGHAALARLEIKKERFWLVTQNVDGLHDRAGSKRILKLHGDIWMMECWRCGRTRQDARVRIRDLPPKCGCGGMMRPGVVWFGEALPPEPWKAAVEAARRADLMLVLGTSAVVYPAAQLPEIMLARGARVVEINPEVTPISRLVGISLRGRTGELLPVLVGP
jgi:NAD-dependent deacetylase